MTSYRLAMPTTLRGSTDPSRALLVALSALFMACEPVPGGDAAAEDSALGEAGPGPRIQDAAPDMRDAAPNSDDAALDASPGPSDAGSEAGEIDGGTHLDAESPTDASDDAASEAGLVRMRSGEVSWTVEKNRGSEYCPQQTVAFWQDETITLNAPASRGFECDLCPNPTDEAVGVQYNFRSDELEIRLDFKSSIQSGHSLEAFRQAHLFSTLTWKTAPKTITAEGWTEFNTWIPEPSVEFLSYAEPLLHVRLQTVVYSTAVAFEHPSTLPYVCFHQTPAGPSPDVCTTSVCGYGTADQDAGVHVSVDVTLPVQAPHDGLNPP